MKAFLSILALLFTLSVAAQPDTTKAPKKKQPKGVGKDKPTDKEMKDTLHPYKKVPADTIDHKIPGTSSMEFEKPDFDE